MIGGTDREQKPSPLILITNDDGVDAPGLRALICLAANLGQTVVVAPDRPRSGMSHAITLTEPVQLKPYHFGDEVLGYACSGTPVDCVKLAFDKVLDKKPDLLLSGINHGPNNSVNVIYSGTMSAALEGAVEHIPSIGFSMMSHDRGIDLSPAADIVCGVSRAVLDNGLPDGVCLNVNIPALPAVKGIRVCRQSEAYWKEDFVPQDEDPGSFMMTGSFHCTDGGEDHDVAVLEAGYASIVPVHADLCAHQTIPVITKLLEGV